MNIKRFLAVSEYPTFANVALLLLRVVAGLAFMLHGWPKIQNSFGWMPPEAPVPGVFQALAAVAEFGGGLAWILGFLTPIASLGLAFTMAVAFSMHAFMRGDPFVSMSGGMSSEPAAGYFCIAVLLLAIGPGRFFVDRAVFGDKPSLPGGRAPV